MIKNSPGQSVGAQMTNATTGADFTGTVTVFITIDAGVRTIGSVGGGICTHEGGGLHTYLPSQAETNGDVIDFQFSGTGALTVVREITTTTLAQTAALGQVTGTAANRGLTVTDLITRSLQDLNIVAAGDVPTPDDLALGFIRLNDILDDLKNESLLVYTVTRTTWTITPNVSTYTIGTGATVNVMRPNSAQQIWDIGFIDTSVSPSLERLFGGVMTEDQRENIPQKGLTGVMPVGWYYSPTFGASGFGTLVPWPVPTGTTLQGVIYTQTPVDEFNALTDTILVPPGYRRLFRNILTIEIAAAFEKQAPASVTEMVRQGRAKLAAQNLRMVDLGFSTAVPGLTPFGAYDILSDTN